MVKAKPSRDRYRRLITQCLAITTVLRAATKPMTVTEIKDEVRTMFGFAATDASIRAALRDAEKAAAWVKASREKVKKPQGLHVTLADIGYADVSHVTVTLGETTLMICAEERGKGVKVYETTGKFLYVLPTATNAVVLKGVQ